MASTLRPGGKEFGCAKRKPAGESRAEKSATIEAREALASHVTFPLRSTFAAMLG